MNDPGNPSYPETFRRFLHAFFFRRLSPGAGSAMSLRMIIAVLLDEEAHVAKQFLTVLPGLLAPRSRVGVVRISHFAESYCS
jgi:hypothetical protein